MPSGRGREGRGEAKHLLTFGELKTVRYDYHMVGMLERVGLKAFITY